MFTLEDLDLYDDAVATYRQLGLSATDDEADARVHPTDYLVVGA